MRSFFNIFTLVILFFASILSCNKSNDSEFFFSDSTEVSKIKITAGDKSFFIEKNNNKWILNRKHKVHNYAVLNFFITLDKMRILSSVAKKNQDSVINNLKKKTLIEIYSKDNDKLKFWYVGEYKKNSEATYMMSGNEEKAYLANLPGLMFDLRKTLNKNEVYWISNYLVDLKARDLKDIKMKNFNNTLESFQLTISEKDIILRNYKGEIQKQIDTTSVAIYLHYFEQIKFDSLSSEDIINKSRTFFKNKALYELMITDNKDKKKNLKIYNLFNPVYSDSIDIHRALVESETDKSIFITRFYNIDLLLKKLSYFIRKE